MSAAPRTNFESWLQGIPRVPGLFACGIRLADRTTLNRSFHDAFTDAALDNAWRCVADTLQVLRSQRCPTEHLRWTFENHQLVCVLRPDGAFLSLFTGSGASQVDLGALDYLMEHFQALPA